jgi:tRNA nucleotidyltransferase (CCA-adding enzyme)
VWYKFAQVNNIDNLIINVPESLSNIFDTLRERGIRPLIVGGAVRDAILGLPNKDVDVECYGVTYDDLETVLKSIPGSFVDSVGKSFGVIKFRDNNGEEYDFSVPRRDSKQGTGHQGFDVKFGVDITPKEAASRRDFTMNSLAYDPFTHKVLDFFGGVKDLEDGILRHTSEAFSEDPLRVLRGMQFAARMGLKVAPETAEISKSIIDQYPTISTERVEQEWHKLVTKGKYPGSALQYLYDTGWDEHFSEIRNIKNINQEFEYHPEGFVDIHTAHVMNEAAIIADREKLTGDNRAVLIYSALAHDFAKAHTTELREKGGVMRWTAHGHEKAGGPLAKEFLEKMGVKKSIIDKVVPLVENHLVHINFKNNMSPGVVKNLAEQLYPATIQELMWLVEADHSGRPPLPKGMPQEAESLYDLAKIHNVHSGKAKPLLQGRDVMKYPIQPGPLIGEILQSAYKAQLDHKITNKPEADKWLKNIIRRYISVIKGDDPIITEIGLNGPEIGIALDKAFTAQLNGEFSTVEGGRTWLRDNYANS